MQVKDIISLLEKEKQQRIIELKNRKENISSSYFMAQHDFKIIENIEDIIKTLDNVIDKLKDCQDRIIELNRQRYYQ